MSLFPKKVEYPFKTGHKIHLNVLMISIKIYIHKYVSYDPKVPQILYNNSLYCFAML